MKQSQSFWPAVFSLVIGTFMAVLDTSIVNVALPKMMNVFGVAATDIQWVVTAYTLAMASVIPLTGYLGNRFGYKRVYMLSFVIFTVGSLLAGFAWSNNSMIAFRIFQALGGGLILPLGQAMLYQVVPREKIPPAMGVYAISVMVAPAVGPTLSGYIVEYLDWHLIFTINVPIGIIGVLMAWTFLPTQKLSEEKQPFDLLGFIYAATMLTTFLLAITKGEEKGWTSFYIVGLFGISLISMCLLVYHELLTEHPLLNLRLFRIPNYTFGLLVGSLITIGLFGAVYLIPIYSESLLGYSAMKTGLLMFPQSVMSGILSLLSGTILIKKFGGKKLMIVGLIGMIVDGIFLAKIDFHTSPSYIQLLLALRGIGVGLSMMPSLQLPLDSLTPDQTGQGSALLNVTRQIATSVGVAILTTIFTTTGTVDAVNYANTFNAYNPINTGFLSLQQRVYTAQGFSPDTSLGMSLNTVLGMVKKYAIIDSMDTALLATNIFLIIAIIFGLLMKSNKKSKNQNVGEETAHMAVEM